MSARRNVRTSDIGRTYGQEGEEADRPFGRRQLEGVGHQPGMCPALEGCARCAAQKPGTGRTRRGMEGFQQTLKGGRGPKANRPRWPASDRPNVQYIGGR
jgi:hypothetical protein